MEKNYQHIGKFFLLNFVLISFLLAANTNAQEEKILARVGDKTISLDEFIRRAEYTVRPAYCKNNFNIDKKIILNSLIAEKLLAIEAGGNNTFISKAEVQAYLQGRKEQLMRLYLYNDEVRSKIKLDTNKINTAFKYAGREYQISYVSLQDSLIAKQLEEEIIEKKIPFEKTLHENYNLQEIPEKKVEWSKLEHPLVLDSLFSKDHKKGDVIGPLKIEDNHYMFIKINSWKNTPAITAKQIENRYNSVHNTYEESEAFRGYVEYVKEIMNGKSLDFNKEVFFELADIFGPEYMNSRKTQEEAFEEGVWDYKKEEMEFRNTKPRLDEIRNEKLFTFDNHDWTVEEFLREIKKHPLVFREKKFPQNKFGDQLQLAILDMIRDECLTKEAYAKGYDDVPGVVRDNQMWKDNLNSLYEKYRILKEAGKDSLFASNYQEVIKSTLNPYVDSLQYKYSDKIFINTDLFNNIKLTKIDLSVTYANSPFSQVVPNFPLVTTDNKLDYGSAVKSVP
ncbi:MAG: hypothetical protein HYS25_09425 [Ignavibacteriales bacterium]|nr:hypothetical protein [Ignavibacteriales bacterium]